MLETGEIRRLGQEERDAQKINKLNVRIIAATNKNIAENSEFRSDLYYRLKVIPISIEPLSNRMSEIPYFVKMYLSDVGIESMDYHFYAFCITNKWEGNIRELKNFCLNASLSKIDKKVYVFNSVHSFFQKEDMGLFDDLDYFRWKNPYSTDEIENSDNLRFHYYISRGQKMPKEVLRYLGYLRFVQENKFREYAAIYGYFKSEKTSWDTSYHGRKEKVIDYSYPEIVLQGIPKFTPKDLLFGVPDDAPPYTKFIKEITYQIMGNYLEFEKEVALEGKGEGTSQSLQVDNYEEAFLSFEKSYFQSIFKRYGRQSDNAIAKTIGRDPKTVKAKRALYTQE